MGDSLRTLINLQLHFCTGEVSLGHQTSGFFFLTEKERAIAVRNRDFGSPPLSSSFICRNTVPHWRLLVKAKVKKMSIASLAGAVWLIVFQRWYSMKNKHVGEAGSADKKDVQEFLKNTCQVLYRRLCRRAGFQGWWDWFILEGFWQTNLHHSNGIWLTKVLWPKACSSPWKNSSVSANSAFLVARENITTVNNENQLYITFKQKHSNPLPS